MNYLENLKVLRDAIEAEPAPKLYLDAWRLTPDDDTPACGTLHCIGGLAATLPYFRRLGMLTDCNGAPHTAVLAASSALEHFFGRYETPDASYPDVGAMYCVFAGFECGHWDRELATAAGAIISSAEDDIEDYINTDIMGHKDLALARLDKAIAYWEARQ